MFAWPPSILPTCHPTFSFLKRRNLHQKETVMSYSFRKRLQKLFSPTKDAMKLMASGINVWVYSSCTAGRADGYWPIWGCYQSTNSQSCMHIGPSSIIPTFPFFKYPLFHHSHFLFQPCRPFPPFITPICYNPFHIAISFMPTFSLPVYMLHSLHPYSHANTSLITTLLSNAHLTHSFPHHPTFIISYPYIPSNHPIPILSTVAACVLSVKKYFHFLFRESLHNHFLQTWKII